VGESRKAEEHPYMDNKHKENLEDELAKDLLAEVQSTINDD